MSPDPRPDLLPMRFIAISSVILCPVCDAQLTVVSAQDRRVATMTHPARAIRCPFASRTFRVDRRTGDAEEMVIRETKPAEVQLPSHGIRP
jgi:hypothetical protein